MRNISIAIDGPAAAGKSTIAQMVAKRINFTYIDTGAMYRAVTYYCLSNNIDCKDEKAVEKVLDNIEVGLGKNHTVFLNKENVTDLIRSPLVNDNVSYIASYKNVRLFLVEQQRKMANVETRAKRRYLENIEKKIDCSYESVLAELKKRDYIDSHRDFAPLKKASDAIELDTSNMSIEEVVNEVLNIINKKVGEINE